MKINAMEHVTKRNVVSAVLAICAALGWWGALYPQFTLLKGTYEIVCEDEGVWSDGDGTEPDMDGAALYWDILNADSSRIRFRSRLLTEWNALQGQAVQEQTLQGQGREVHGSENQ